MTEVKWRVSCSVVSNSLQPHGPQTTRLLRPWNSPGKNTGVGCHFLLQILGINSWKKYEKWHYSHVKNMKYLCIYFRIGVSNLMATHSSTLAWRIPWREEPGRLQSMGSQRVGHNWATSLSFTFQRAPYRKVFKKRHLKHTASTKWSSSTSTVISHVDSRYAWYEKGTLPLWSSPSKLQTQV